jgi:N-acetylglutamate synthase-like GNAT family acetyltransferase
MKIRNYSEKDKNAVQNIFAKYWTDEEFLNELERNLDEHGAHFYVAEKDGEVVGVAGFRESQKTMQNCM